MIHNKSLPLLQHRRLHHAGRFYYRLRQTLSISLQSLSLDWNKELMQQVCYKNFQNYTIYINEYLKRMIKPFAVMTKRFSSAVVQTQTQNFSMPEQRDPTGSSGPMMWSARTPSLERKIDYKNFIQHETEKACSRW